MACPNCDSDSTLTRMNRAVCTNENCSNYNVGFRPEDAEPRSD